MKIRNVIFPFPFLLPIPLFIALHIVVAIDYSGFLNVPRKIDPMDFLGIKISLY